MGMTCRDQLENRGIPFSEEQFLRQIRSGNKETVELFLSCGISPNTSLDGESAMAVAATAGFKEIVEILLKAGANPMALYDSVRSKQSKDAWEKLASLSGAFTFLSSIVIAIIGWYFTSSYNDRQLALAKTQALREQENKDYQNRLTELQTVEKMIPHLAKDEASKRAALVAISVLANPKLAAKFAELFPGQGSIDALKQIATTNTPSESVPVVSALTSLAARERSSTSKPASDALGVVFQDQDKERSIVQLLYSNESFCNGFIVDGNNGWVATAAYCLSRFNPGDLQEVEIQLWNGTRLKVKEFTIATNYPVAFVHVDTIPFQSMELSANQLAVGDAITQIGFTYETGVTARPTLRAIVGQVIKTGSMKFIGGGAKEFTAPGLQVTFGSISKEHRQASGTAGAPLLDREGKVACLTYQGDAERDQCLAADAIRAAMQSNHIGE